MALVRCEPLTMPDAPPSIHIPHFGDLQSALLSIRKIPDPDELITDLMKHASVALAPVRRYLEMVEITVYLFDCIKAIPMSIITLDPGRIYDCMENLSKAIARILSYFPPMEYVRTLVDLLAFAIDVIDAIVTAFSDLDAKLAAYAELDVYAIARGNTDLSEIVTCSRTDVDALITQMFALLKYIIPMISILLSPIMRFIPSVELQKTANNMVVFNASLLGFEASFRENQETSGLGQMLTDMNEMRSSLVMAHNVLAPIVGLDGDKTNRELPEFRYF